MAVALPRSDCSPYAQTHGYVGKAPGIRAGEDRAADERDLARARLPQRAAGRLRADGQGSGLRAGRLGLQRVRRVSQRDLVHTPMGPLRAGRPRRRHRERTQRATGRRDDSLNGRGRCIFGGSAGCAGRGSTRSDPRARVVARCGCPRGDRRGSHPQVRSWANRTVRPQVARVRHALSPTATEQRVVPEDSAETPPPA